MSCARCTDRALCSKARGRSTSRTRRFTPSWAEPPEWQLDGLISAGRSRFIAEAHLTQPRETPVGLTLLLFCQFLLRALPGAFDLSMACGHHHAMPHARSIHPRYDVLLATECRAARGSRLHFNIRTREYLQTQLAQASAVRRAFNILESDLITRRPHFTVSTRVLRTLALQGAKHGTL
jgi:hypothetical protein